MTIKGQATVFLVSDVPASADYYRDKLGFEIQPFDEEPPHYAFANRDEVWVHLADHHVEPVPNSKLVPPDMFDAYFYTDDVHALHKDLSERGAEIVQGLVEQGYGVTEFRVRDPNGYVLAFGQIG
jgi:catechol 2,3-dioxygenase-like lactoylglutathione lyase family enzyme